MILKITNLKCGYIKNRNILEDININLKKGETIAVIGQNGAGKSTLAKSIVNLIPFIQGNILFKGKEIINMKTEKIILEGIGFFLQGGKIFPHLTLEENLIMAGLNLNKNELQKRIKEIKNYFPIFNKKHLNNIQASYLSGGEKHQLALSMVLMQKPSLLILDEPSAGLSPLNVKTLYKILLDIKKNENLSLFIIEQNVNIALQVSDYLYILKNGKIIFKTETQKITLQKIEEIFFE